MLHVVNSFQGGVTTLDRVDPSSDTVLAKCSGYDVSDKSLRPEGVAERVSVDPELGGEMPEQTPIAFLDASAVERGASRLRLICWDGDEKVRMVVVSPADEPGVGSWSVAGDALNMLKESAPVKLGGQVIFPTGGADSKLMVYEPNSATTKTRPLSLKSPWDYEHGSRPNVTLVGDAPPLLFDNNDSNAWVTTDSGKWSVSTTDDKVTFTITENHPGGAQKMFKKSLGTLGLDLSGKSYLAMDIMIQGDAQKYTETGLFPNDSSILPSGYEVRFYSDTTCNTQVGASRIPKLEHDGMVHRVLLRLPAGLSVVKGIAIWSASTPLFVKPAVGKTFSLALYSNAYKPDWSQLGNMLLPDIQFSPAELQLVQSFQALTGTASGVAIEQTALTNVIQNPGFESGSACWALHSATGDGHHSATVYSGSGHSGGKCANVVGNGIGYPSYFEQTNVPLVAGKTYTFSAWYERVSVIDPHLDTSLKVTITPNAGSPIVFSMQGAALDVWVQFIDRFVAPANSTSATLRISAEAAGYHFDDLSLNAIDPTYPGAAAVIQYWSDGATSKTPDSSYLQYEYCFCARDVLSADTWQYMVSNPSDPFPADAETPLFADPCRTYRVDITLPVDAVSGLDFGTEYGDYGVYVLLYRRIYDGSTGVWGSYYLIAAAPMTGGSVSFVDSGAYAQANPAGDGRFVPETVELSNDYLSSGRYVMVSGHRVYAGCLDWDESSGVWKRPTAIAVSGYDRPWTFPTTSDENSLATDGEELDGYAVTGTEIRGLIARGSEKFVFLDDEFFMLRGEDPLNGWQFMRIDGIGCVSARTLADCRSMFIWHDGTHFHSFSGGLARPISRFKIDSSLIDWSRPHNAVYHADRYVFFCTGTDGVHRLMMYDLAFDAWHIRESEALDLVGICVGGGTVYGITPGGSAVDVLGSLSVDAVRDVWTQYLVIASPPVDVLVREAVFEVVTEESGGVDLDLTFKTQGAKNGTVEKTLHVTPDKTRHRVGLNLQCNAVQVRIRYSGATLPVVYSIGLVTDEVSTR